MPNAGLETERIVVGVDGSENARRALQWAVDEARRRHATVEAVCAWHPPYVSSYAYIPEIDPGLFEADAEQILDEAVGAVRATGIVIEKKPLLGGAAEVLADEAKGAALVVVGSRGRGGFAGLVLGSVSQQVVHHAPCPVVIVPPAP